MARDGAHRQMDEAGTAQLELLSNSRITSEGGEATDLALLFVGSPNTSTNRSDMPLATLG